MTQSKKPLSVAEQKKVISQKMRQFENRLNKSQNAFDRVCIFNDIEDVIDSEIISWVQEVEKLKESGDKAAEDRINEAAKHVADLQGLIDTFNKYRAIELPEALKIQQAMINSHKLSKPVITSASVKCDTAERLKIIPKNHG
jgi:predicted enzyme involved in methoxymalonyl-ACP biosynthesis